MATSTKVGPWRPVQRTSEAVTDEKTRLSLRAMEDLITQLQQRVADLERRLRAASIA